MPANTSLAPTNVVQPKNSRDTVTLSKTESDEKARAESRNAYYDLSESPSPCPRNPHRAAQEGEHYSLWYNVDAKVRSSKSKLFVSMVVIRDQFLKKSFNHTDQAGKRCY